MVAPVSLADDDYSADAGTASDSPTTQATRQLLTGIGAASSTEGGVAGFEDRNPGAIEDAAEAHADVVATTTNSQTNDGRNQPNSTATDPMATMTGGMDMSGLMDSVPGGAAGLAVAAIGAAVLLGR